MKPYLVCEGKKYSLDDGDIVRFDLGSNSGFHPLEASSQIAALIRRPNFLLNRN